MRFPGAKSYSGERDRGRFAHSDAMLNCTGSPFFCGRVTGQISRAKWSASMAATARIWLLRAMRSCLRLALDFEIAGDVFSRFGNGIDAVLRLHERVDEAPADGGVVHCAVAAEGRIRRVVTADLKPPLANHERAHLHRTVCAAR